MNRLQGKVALVTGASMGFGAAIAGRLAKEGAAVAVNYPDGRLEADAVVTKIVMASGRAIAVNADITKRDQVEQMVKQVTREFGSIDILVNNAGVYEFVALDSVTEDHFHRLFNVNVLGTILVTQACMPHFKEAGGSVINISSIVSVCPSALAPVYSATKGAIDALTKSLAKSHAGRNIRFNTINPGLTPTDGIERLGQFGRELLQDILEQTPLGRNGMVEDVAAAVVFFASNESSFITGESLAVSGGRR